MNVRLRSRSSLRLLQTVLIVSSLLCLAPARRAAAQGSEADISARLLHRPLYLRDSWGENKLEFDNGGHPLKPYRVVPFTVAAIDIDKVQRSGDRLDIQGRRVGLEFDRSGRMTREVLPGKVEVVVDAAAGTDLRPALDAVFTEDLAEVPSACTGPWLPYAETHWLAHTSSGQPGEVGRHSPANASVLRVGGDVLPPKILAQKNPVFSEEARSLRYTGDVTVSAWVQPDGTTAHVTVRRPAGLALDERAVAAVESYRFRPATRNGQPVTVEIYVDVNFQTFEH